MSEIPEETHSDTHLAELKLISLRLNLILTTLVTIASILLAILTAICFSARAEAVGVSLGVIAFGHFLYQGFRKQQITDWERQASRKSD